MRDAGTTGLSDAATLTSGHNGGMDSAARHPASVTPAGLPRPVPAAVAVWAAALLSLVLFGLMTVAGAAALLVAAYESGLVVPGRDHG